MKRTPILFPVLTALLLASCAAPGGKERPVELVVLDPGHFHASLLQKNRLQGVSDTVRVYAPEGPEAQQYLAAVRAFNSRPDDPTAWCEEVYLGDDYLERMLTDGRGDVVVLAGNNRRKTGYILDAVRAGYSVLSDKPLAISGKDFRMLCDAYAQARENGVLIYDLMTERYDRLNAVARELLNDSLLFGSLLPGSADEPSVTMRSEHNFFKEVSGKPLIRPAWYYDVEQQGEGIADVTTHLIDLVNWQCFPGEAVRYRSDVEVLAARHYPTRITLSEFTRSTGAEALPPYLEKYVKDGVLEVMANGSLVYRVKGIHVGMEVVWNYTSPAGGDTFASVMKGSNAWLEVVQDASTGFVKQLYIRRSPAADAADFEARLDARAAQLRQQIPSLSVEKQGADRYLIDILPKDRLGHEAHFSRVAETFLNFVRKGELPEWENENTLSKYYITTTAVQLAGKQTN